MTKPKFKEACLRLVMLGGLGILAGGLGVAYATETLPRLGVTLSATSVSGLSSGAYMAGQIEVAHSKDIVGAGIVAGGGRDRGEPPLPLPARGDVAERRAGGQPLHEGLLGRAGR